MLNVVLLIILTNALITKLIWPDVTTKVEISWKTKAQFPAVTICNVNQFKVGTSSVLGKMQQIADISSKKDSMASISVGFKSNDD